jgi:hypothetical protein
MGGQHRTTGLTGARRGRARAKVLGLASSAQRAAGRRGRPHRCLREGRRLPGNAPIEWEVPFRLLEGIPVRLGSIVPGGRPACGADRRRTRRLAKSQETLLDGRGLGDAHVHSAVGTDQGQGFEQPGLRGSGQHDLRDRAPGSASH